MAVLTGAIKPRRGLLTNLPGTVTAGELVTTTDAGNERLYVGSAAAGTPVQIAGAAVVAASHAAVTLDANADTLLSLSTQALGLDTQAANRVLAGPISGGNAVPAFRALVTADLPANTPIIKRTEIDFGTTPVLQKTFTITDAGVSAASFIMAQLAYVAPTGKSLDELEFDSFDFRAAPGTGNFTLHARALEGSVAGNFKINYLYNPS